MNQYLLAAIEFSFIGSALFVLFPILGWEGLFGLFLAFVGFELHLIWHRKDRETKAAQKRDASKKHK
ncbi:MAG: hypothetical protein CVU50_05400 [Candidatus Cloacimonetes bacterium HGW-Cloacimonetes-3]|jgi:hypothetical protein|nr:MAG: hypothetical protein CVU50_05400 [Candidatus Cloacimonetes bacterium HGW-Cloacimonetes-3]